MPRPIRHCRQPIAEERHRGIELERLQLFERWPARVRERRIGQICRDLIGQRGVVIVRLTTPAEQASMNSVLRQHAAPGVHELIQIEVLPGLRIDDPLAEGCGRHRELACVLCSDQQHRLPAPRGGRSP